MSDNILYEAIDPSILDFSNAPYVQKRRIKIHARCATIYEKIETVLINGHHESDKDAFKGDYIITNSTGEEYPLSTKRFHQEYEDSDEIGMFVPKWDPKQFIITDRNVVFELPWGNDMKMLAGSAVVYGGINDIYGIDGNVFTNTHKAVNDMSTEELNSFGVTAEQVAPFLTKPSKTSGNRYIIPCSPK